MLSDNGNETNTNSVRQKEFARVPGSASVLTQAVPRTLQFDGYVIARSDATRRSRAAAALLWIASHDGAASGHEQRALARHQSVWEASTRTASLRWVISRGTWPKPHSLVRIKRSREKCLSAGSIRFLITSTVSMSSLR